MMEPLEKHSERGQHNIQKRRVVTNSNRIGQNAQNAFLKSAQLRLHLLTIYTAARLWGFVWQESVPMKRPPVCVLHCPC